MKSEVFKSEDLLAMCPGDVLVIECASYRDMESKSSMSRQKWKRYGQEFRERGINSLDVSNKADMAKGEYKVTIKANA